MPTHEKFNVFQSDSTNICNILYPNQREKCRGWIIDEVERYDTKLWNPLRIGSLISTIRHSLDYSLFGYELSRGTARTWIDRSLCNLERSEQRALHGNRVILRWKAFPNDTPGIIQQRSVHTMGLRDLTRPLSLRNSAKHPYCLLYCASGHNNVNVYTVKPSTKRVLCDVPQLFHFRKTFS